MKLGWHCSSKTWFYGTAIYKQVSPPADDPRPSGIVMYTEGPCAAINEQLRTGRSVYDKTRNFDVSFDTVIEEIDSVLNDAEVPAVVLREDDGQLEAAIFDNYVVDTGYLSTSIIKDYRGHRCARRYKIFGLKPGCGADISGYSRFNDEKEFLFRRNSKFSVVEKNLFDAVGQEGIEYVLRYEGVDEEAVIREFVFNRLPRYEICPFCKGATPVGSWECVVCGAT